MNGIANRHEGDLGGRLAPFAATRKVVVGIDVPRDVASLAACQHTLWMLTNLLARSEGIVERILIACPPGARLAGRIVPLAPRSLDLASAIAQGAAAIGSVPVEMASGIPTVDVRFNLGPGAVSNGAIRVHGEGWWGGISRGSIATAPASSIPFGPYAAACLAASEVFKHARMSDYIPVESAFYSTWSFIATESLHDVMLSPGPAEFDALGFDMALAGVGAVGSAWVHAMWASNGIHGNALLADSDPEGVDLTNLNRTPIFGRSSVGRPKASEAAAICSDALLTWRPHDGPISAAPERPAMVLSAVDTNASRRAIQSLYPARLISASTYDLRAEAMRCDPAIQTACLSCFNPVAQAPSDEELRKRFLRIPATELEEIIQTLNISRDQAEMWAASGVCGQVGDTIIRYLRPSTDGPAAFAVGFVSVMAGTMLAAQTIKEALEAAPLRGLENRAIMQFFEPTAGSNCVKPFAREASCAACDPGSPGARRWRQRYESFSTGNNLGLERGGTGRSA